MPQAAVEAARFLVGKQGLHMGSAAREKKFQKKVGKGLGGGTPSFVFFCANSGFFDYQKPGASGSGRGRKGSGGKAGSAHEISCAGANITKNSRERAKGGHSLPLFFCKI